jgi:hypothetical protein
MGSNNFLSFFLIICMAGGLVLSGIIFVMHKIGIKKWIQRLIMVFGIILILFSLPCYLFIGFNDSLSPIAPRIPEISDLMNDLQDTYKIEIGNYHITAKRPFSCVIHIETSGKCSKEAITNIKNHIENVLNGGLYEKIKSFCKKNYDFLRVPNKNNVWLELSGIGGDPQYTYKLHIE